jgi:predicted unusual protein kinase regulating ubiquinone biosynthesis (AarF/ABC1/UbiB family)
VWGSVCVVSVGELNFKNVINKLGDVMYKFPFSLPPYYIAIIRCLGVLEGLAIQVRSHHLTPPAAGGTMGKGLRLVMRVL